MRMITWLALSIFCACPSSGMGSDRSTTEPEAVTFRPGQVWLDADGHPIQAHGGGVLLHDGVYYWYGENKNGPTLNKNRVDVIGISCYSSCDLYRWKFEGLALKAVPDDASHDLHPNRVCERPKVVYNEKTRKFVMWVHIDDAKYQAARTGVAVADRPAGPFRYVGSFRPNGGESRDMTVFQDDDGKAYVVFGSGWHTHVQIAELTDDYLQPSGVYTNHFQRPGPPTGREAPALQTPRSLLPDHIRHDRLGLQRSALRRRRFDSRPLDRKGQSLCRRECGQDLLLAKHVRVTCGRQARCIHLHGGSLEQRKPGRFAIRLVACEVQR